MGIIYSLRNRFSFFKTLIFLVFHFITSLVLSFFIATNIFLVTRLLSYGVFLHIPLTCLILSFIYFKKNKRLSVYLYALSFTVVGVAIEAFILEPKRIQLTKYDIRSEKVRSPLKIVVLSDIQSDDIGEYEEKVFQMTVAEKPDIVLLPGDFLQCENLQTHIEQSVKLNQLFNKYFSGSSTHLYAVQGNVDIDDWQASFRNTPVKIFENTDSLTVNGIHITGLGLMDSFNSDLKLDSVNEFHIVFGHSPDFSLGRVDADLLIAGHTHGGQVYIPFVGPLMTFSSVPRSWASGLTEMSWNKTLIVSKGVGMERGMAPRMRFLCEPEVVVVNILPLK